MHKIDQFVEHAVAEALSIKMPKVVFSGRNTIVRRSLEQVEVILHGHTIFTCNCQSKEFELNDCGYPSRTTASRMNACLRGIRSDKCVFRRLDKTTKHWKVLVKTAA